MNKISYVIIAILVSACTQVTIILLVIVVWITLSKFEPNYIVDILEYVALATGLFWSVLVMIYTPYLIERIFKVDLFGKVNKDENKMAGTLNEDMICPFLAGGFVARYGDEITFTFESTVKCMCSRCMLWDNVRDWCSLKTQRNIDKKK